MTRSYRLCGFEVAAGIIQWTLRQASNEEVCSVNAVVGETNDGYLNDIRARRVTPERRSKRSSISDLPNEQMTPIFQAVVEATEEAVINSLFAAKTTDGHRGWIEALPVEEVMKLYRRSRR